MSDNPRPLTADAAASARHRGTPEPAPMGVKALRRVLPSAQGVTGVVLALVAALVATSTIFGAAHDPANAAAHPVGALRSGAAGAVVHSTVASTAVATSAQLNVVPALAVRRHKREPVAGQRFGMDVSWPQCGVALPAIKLDFAVIGLTDGHASSVSPCLDDQIRWAHRQHLKVGLYVVPNSPSAGSPQGFAAGVAQAKHALAEARRVHATTKSWWLDIEESAQGTLWSSDTTANVAVLKGWVHTLRKAGKNVGVYSTGGYWWMITNNWRTRLPQWVAVGLGGIDRAREACARPFTDGPVVMTQWLTGPYDGNLLCTKAQRKKLTTGWHGEWFRAHTAGVPSLLTTPVPHPEIEALLKAEAAAFSLPARDHYERAYARATEALGDSAQAAASAGRALTLEQALAEAEAALDLDRDGSAGSAPAS